MLADEPQGLQLSHEGCFPYDFCSVPDLPSLEADISDAPSDLLLSLSSAVLPG